LGRFSWFLFWAINFIIAIFIEQLFIKTDKKYLKIIATILILFLVIDTKDFIVYLNTQKQKNQLTHTDNFNEIIDITKKIDVQKYQAILPIPYFHTGSEDYNFTIDAPSSWLNQCGQIQQATSLPLMASQMSRTAHYQPQELFSIFTDSIPNANLLRQLNDKPILVFYSKSLNNEENLWCKNEREPAKTVAYSRKSIIEKYDMTLVAEVFDFLIYRWDVANIRK
jgi:hypothetical protein